jgi:putative transposase
MRKSRFSDQQIALALQQVEHGASIAEVCRKFGITEQTYYRRKKKFGQMAPSEIKKLKQIEDENRRLKSLVAVRTGVIVVLPPGVQCSLGVLEIYKPML